MSRAIATVLLTIMTTAITSISCAENPATQPALPKITVRFGDLNTSTPEGIKSLYTRLRGAAYEVCLKDPAWFPNQTWYKKGCYRETLNNVVTSLNLPELTALHRSNGVQSPIQVASAQTR